MDAAFCPSPDYKVLHMFDTLFTAGPCLLGASINRILGRAPQAIFESGELFPENDVHASGNHPKVPGRTVILKQEKADMGLHRFTLVEKNLVVAATSLPYSDDRVNRLQQKSGTNAAKMGDEAASKPRTSAAAVAAAAGGEHYSRAHAKIGIYGLENLYADLNSADEDIRIVVHASSSSS